MCEPIRDTASWAVSMDGSEEFPVDAQEVLDQVHVRLRDCHDALDFAIGEFFFHTDACDANRRDLRQVLVNLNCVLAHLYGLHDC